MGVETMANAMTELRQDYTEDLVGKFQKYFDDERLVRELGKAAEKGEGSFNIDWADLSLRESQLGTDFAIDLLDHPDIYIRSAEEAVARMHIPVAGTEGAYAPHARFYNLPDSRRYRPMVLEMGAEELDKLVSLEGVISSISEIKPRMKIAAWECRNCRRTFHIPTQKIEAITPPLVCPNGECRKNAFRLVEEQSVFINQQRAQIQDPVEKMRGNVPPSQLHLWLEEDLVNQIAPGDKVVLTGVLRLKPITQQKAKNSVYDKFFEVIHIHEMEIEFEELVVSREEEEEILRLAKDPKLFDKIVASIAPTIYGYTELKQAIALQLFGGTAGKSLPDGKQFRSDIHVAMIGDPGCLSADERIILGNGAIVKIGEVGSEHLQKIKLAVLTGEGGAKRGTANVFHCYPNQPVMEIVTESGKSIVGTPNHPLLCLETNDAIAERKWKRLDQLRLGDRLAAVTGIPCTITKNIPTGFAPLPAHLGPKFRGKLPPSLTPALASILGYALGDGWVTDTEVGFVVAGPEKDILPQLIANCENEFGLTPHFNKHELKNGRAVPLHYYSIYSKDIASNLKFLRSKRVPGLVMRSGNVAVAAFLRWLFEADGTVFDKGRGRRAVGLKSANIELLRDVQILLLRFGIHSRIVGNALLIRRGFEIKKFQAEIGFVSAKKRGRLASLCRNAEKFSRVKGRRSERIMKISLLPPRDVFDIEVPNSHRFIANGIISHNTGKSTMMEYVAHLAPKCIVVSGGSSSAVGLCVAPDSLILNGAGLKPIAEFVEENWKGSCREEIPGAFAEDFDGKAWTLGDGLKITQERISKIWRIRAPSQMVRITTRMGREITLTPATSLIAIDEMPAWKEAAKLNVGEFVATARNLPQGDSRTPAMKILENCPNLRVQCNLSGVFREITDTLALKRGTLRKVAKAYEIAEDDLYLNRSAKYWGNMELSLLAKMARDAQLEEKLDSKLSSEAREVFLHYGCNTRIPAFLEDGKLAYLAGLLLGDGDCSRSPNQASMRFSNTSEELLQAFERSVKELFGVSCRRDKPSWRIPSIRLHSLPAYLLLREFGLVPKKTEISLSHAALNMPNPILASLLRGLFDTDGYVSRSKTGSPHVGISTVSPGLAKTLQLALLKFGIVAKLRRRKRAGVVSKGRTATITSRNDAHVVEIRGVENFRRFSQEIGFTLERKRQGLLNLLTPARHHHTNIDLMPLNASSLQGLDWGYRKGRTKPSREMLAKTAEKSGDAKLAALASSDVFWDEITKIETFKPEYEWVYDFSVENSHNFICNGFFTHNTAAAEKDEIGEGWILKAGAMVLANGGIVAVDELDKLDEEDRGAMHQAMEQQKISVAKAGIVTEFRTKTAVLAAANPKHGRFDPNSPPASQFAISPALLSRFDLIFTMRDVLDEARDKGLAHHLLEGHMLAGTQGKSPAENPNKPAIPVELLRKYIAYARRTCLPQLTEEATGKIGDYYVDLRKIGKEQNTFPITARQIEGLIRMAEANAKMRLSPLVELQDADRAVKLEDFVLHEVFVDKETGKLDSDVINIGQAKSRIDRVRNVLNIVADLEKQFDLVAIDDVVREASNHGVDEFNCRHLIDELKRKGELYEPKAGFVKLASKKDW
ncbi:ATP-binding protein [Candidatus Micrarchaeota archaeon]|nr:ATP-binding protein [Candidatus Micrarchaeota archaeon]